MADKTNKTTPDRNDKNSRQRFNTNWIFAILAVAIILFEILFSSKAVQKATTSMIKDMFVNHHIEKLIVVNKDQAENYLSKEAIDSGKYPDLPKSGGGLGFPAPKPQYSYNIGDISNFEPTILDI